ncbi:MAG: DUF5118 domain-containing protein, partial [Candidatus Hodarchaeota archaeon]
MRYIVLCYYHAIRGPIMVLSIPNEIESRIRNDLCRTLDFLEEPGFFVQHKTDYKIVNWYFEIPDELARGGTDMLLVSLVLIDDDIDVLCLQDPLEHLVDELKSIHGLNRISYFERSEEDKQGQYEVKSVLQDFLDSLPDSCPPIIRRMKKDDLNRIIEIDHQLLGKKRPELWKGKFEMLNKKSALPSLVAEMGNKVIGFILGE